MLQTYVKTLVVAALAVSAAVMQSQTVKGTIALPNLPEQVAVNPVANLVFVAVPNYGAEPYDYLTVINGHTDTIVKNIKIPPVAYAVAVDDFTGIVYVGGSYVDANDVTQNEVVAVNPFTGRVLHTFLISNTPGNGVEGLAVNSLNGEVYVANSSDNEVEVIRGCKIVASIATTATPFSITVNPLVNTAYMEGLDGSVTLINAKSHSITDTVASGISGGGIAVDLITSNVFATNSVTAPSVPSVGVLDKEGNALATVTVGNLPLGIDVDLGTKEVFVANTGDDTLSVFSETTEAVTNTLPVSSLFLAVNPATRKVYVAPIDNTPLLTVVSE